MPHGVCSWCAVAASISILIGAQPLVVAPSFAVPASQAYSFRGAIAPQVHSNPLATELQQKLKLLQAQLTDRSIRVSLSDAIERSLLHNPELAQAYGQIQQRQWNLVAVRRQWYPSLSASAAGPAGALWGYRRSSTNISTTTANDTVDQQITQRESQLFPIVSLGWTFFDPSRGPQINAAGESLRSQELLFNVAARNLVLQTQLAYFNLQEQQQLRVAYQAILNASTDQVRQSEALFNAGDASIADVEQIRTQQFQTLTLLIQTHLRIVAAAASLARAMALPPGQLVLPDTALERYGEWDLSVASTIAQAQSLREEIQSSLAEANSANWRASALFNSYWPRFSLLANVFYADASRRSEVAGGSPADVQQSRTLDGSVGIGFTWSIFDGGIAAAQAQADKALARQFSDQVEVQRLQISEEVEQSYASYSASRLAVLSSREQADAALKAADAVRERFKVGYADMTTVVQALNLAVSGANAYSTSLREYNNAVASLYRVSAQWPQYTFALLRRREDSLKRR